MYVNSASMFNIKVICEVNLCQEESLREQHDFTDLLQVWHNNHHRTEECLHRFWQFRSSSIAWVHGDEDTHTTVQVNLCTFKLKQTSQLFEVLDKHFLTSLSLRR